MQAFRKSLLVTLALTALLAACAPAQPSQEQVQSLVQTSVAATMQAQNQVGTFVAQTVQAQQPAATETIAPTATSEFTETPFPTLTPVGFIPSPTSAPVSSGGGGGYVAPAPVAWSCDPDIDKRPLDGAIFAPGDHFEIKWILKNTGTQDWPAGFDLTFFSVQPNVPEISINPGTFQLPAVKSGNLSPQYVLEGIAPNKAGNYVETWKLQGGWCWPYIAITVK